MKTKTLVLVAAALLASACASVTSSEDAALLARAQQHFKPLPADAGTAERPLTPERVALGRALFFEPRLSVDDRISCATCHQPSFYGAEPLASSGCLQRAATGKTGALANCAGTSPVRLSRNATMSDTSASLSSRPSCNRPMMRTASSTLGHRAVVEVRRRDRHVAQLLGACRAWASQVRSGPSEDSFCRICRPIVQLWDKSR